jgi:UDP-N-acetylglucosamine 2-epimerase
MLELLAGDYEQSMIKSDMQFRRKDLKPDLVYIAGDRTEMLGCAAAAFHNNIPIVHYGSGVVNGLITTFDDINRHCIGLWATIALCEDRKSYMTINRLWNTIGKDTLRDKMNMHIVGNVYLDDWEVDENLVPNEPYDLILINPTTLTNEFAVQWETIRKEISIGCNPDAGYSKNFKVTYDNLPRPQFLGLMKNCERYITNSSNVYYESDKAGLKEEQIVMVGSRNINRSSPKQWNQDWSSSDKIVKILKKWWKQNG